MVEVSSLHSFFLSSAHILGSKTTITTIPFPPSLCVRFRHLRFSAAYISAGKRRPSSLYSQMYCSASDSLYEILGIPIDATCQEIKSAYRKLVRLHHPDVVAIDRKDSSANEFMKIHAAYSTLLDPQKRADYDQKLFRGKRRLNSQYATSAHDSSSSSSYMSGVSGCTRRTWETDQCW